MWCYETPEPCRLAVCRKQPACKTNVCTIHDHDENCRNAKEDAKSKGLECNADVVGEDRGRELTCICRVVVRLEIVIDVRVAYPWRYQCITRRARMRNPYACDNCRNEKEQS